MDRRTALMRAGLALAAAGVWVRASGADGGPRVIGWLGNPSPEGGIAFIEVLKARIEAKGYKRDRDFVFVPRFGGGNIEVLPALARELVALRPDVIIAVGGPSAAAAAAATKTIPVLMHYIANPVEVGLVASLSRPGGNVTGTTYSQPEIAGKLLEVLKVANPSIVKVAIFRNPDNLGIKLYTPHAMRTAERLGMKLHYFELRHPRELQLEQLDQARPDALYLVNDFVVVPLYGTLVKYALERKLPTIGVSREFVLAGGMMSMSPDTEELENALVEYIDRVLKGASPATLPVREPSRFPLVVSRKAANAIGLPLSQELLIRANEVID